MSELLCVKNITKIYQKGQMPGLDRVSFDVREGEFVGIMGASGSGKTTLLNVLSTIDKPTNGEIKIKGISINGLKENAAADFRSDNIGFIFQEYFLLQSLTVRENIAVPLTLKKMNAQEIDQKVENLAKRFGIGDKLSKYPSELSGGQQQRVAAARAIVKDPAILFADEPTGALDSSSATELLNTLKEINKELKTTILMVTHDAYAASFSKRILIFKDGKIVNEFYRNEKSRNAFYDMITKEVAKLDEKR